MRSLRFLLLLIPAGTCVAAFWGCGGAAANGEAGGVGGAPSGVSGTTVSGTSGSGSFATSGSGGSATGNGLAGTCTADTDCGGDLWCLHPTTTNDPVFGGGAPRGFCTKACVMDPDCGPGAVCFANTMGQTGHCTLGCTIGPPVSGVEGPLTPLSTGKCRGRDDVRCAETSGDAGACLPTCSSDDQCGGDVCDPVHGVCVSTPPDGGLPTGVACDPTAKPNACEGLCVAFKTPGDVSICSRPCVFGGASDSSLECGGPQNGLCGFHRDDFGAGDLGYCTLACSGYADCLNPRYGCFTVPNLTPSSGKGYCFAASGCPISDGGDDGGDGGDCGGGLVCAQTPVGPLCLDPAFALPDGGFGDAGPSPSDAGDAGSHDAGTDGGPIDGAVDAGPIDGAVDAGPIDGADDAGTDDGGASDAGPLDAGLHDAGGSDAGAKDAGGPDAGDGG